MKLKDLLNKEFITQEEADEVMMNEELTKTEIKQTVRHWDMKIQQSDRGFGHFHVENNEIVYGDLELKIRNIMLNDQGELTLPFKSCRGLIITASNLKSFKNFPKKIISASSLNWSFTTHQVQDAHYISSLEGFPADIEGFVDMSDTRYEHLSYHNVHKYINKIHGMFQMGSYYEGPLLGFVTIPELFSITFKHGSDRQVKVQNIITHHLRGDRDMLDCQEELIQSGFKEYAKI